MSDAANLICFLGHDPGGDDRPWPGLDGLSRDGARGTWSLGCAGAGRAAPRRGAAGPHGPMCAPRECRDDGPSRATRTRLSGALQGHALGPRQVGSRMPAIPRWPAAVPADGRPLAERDLSREMGAQTTVVARQERDVSRDRPGAVARG